MLRHAALLFLLALAPLLGFAALPTVTTTGETHSSYFADLQGTANPNGEFTLRAFFYSTINPGACSESFGTMTLPLGTTNNLAEPYNIVVSGLMPGTTYYFCAFAANQTGKAFGSVLSFTTDDAPRISMDPAVDFGSRPLTAGAVSRSLTVTNVGTANLVVSSATVTAGGAEFTVTGNNCGNVAPAGTCNIQLAFDPTTAGLRSGTLSIVANDPYFVGVWDPNNPTRLVALSGTGVELPTFALTAALSGSGSGTITAPGITCPGDCGEQVVTGTVVTVAATPAAGSTFAGWSGACGGTGTCAVTMDAPMAVTATFVTTPAEPTELRNIATRGKVLTGADVMIAGFVITGGSPLTVVVRVRGPSLTQAGVPGVLANPQVQLFSGQTQIAFNDNWQTASNAAELQASGFAPADPAEAAILITLDPGAYTAIATGVGQTTGVAIIEVFRN